MIHSLFIYCEKTNKVPKPVIFVKICYTVFAIQYLLIDKVTSWSQLMSKLLVAPTWC